MRPYSGGRAGVIACRAAVAATTTGRDVEHGGGMHSWKALAALAVISGIAAPVVAGTWQVRPNAQSWIALTPERRAVLLAGLENSKNCRYFETQVEARDVLGLTADSRDIAEAVQCHREQDALRDGGEMRSYFSLGRYLAVNAAIASAGAAGTVGLAILVALLFRRYRLQPES
jgi:hypothetical protein